MIEEWFWIQNASNPLEVEKIRHEFKDLQDSSKYNSYIDHRWRKYSLLNTNRWILGQESIEAKMVDNYVILNTQDSYNYSNKVTPSKFYWKLKSTTANTNRWRGQFWHSSIVWEDWQAILRFMVRTHQASWASYARWRTSKFCNTSYVIDEYECWDNVQIKWKYIELLYKKSNWKYSIVNYKIPDYLTWEYIFEYEADFNKKNLNIVIKDSSKNTLENININFDKLSDFKDIDFSNFKYYSNVLATNWYNQKFSPYEIWVDFNKSEILEETKKSYVKSFKKNFIFRSFFTTWLRIKSIYKSRKLRHCFKCITHDYN